MKPLKIETLVAKDLGLRAVPAVLDYACRLERTPYTMHWLVFWLMNRIYPYSVRAWEDCA